MLCLCPCDDDRDAKEDDCDDVSTSDQFSRKQLRNATTNTPPLTTHHALIVCEAVRYVCPCDDDRDAKEDDCDDVSTSDQFSRIKLRNATIIVLRRQKPLGNALDGLLYFPCVDCMLEARWVEGCAESLPRHICV